MSTQHLRYNHDFPPLANSTGTARGLEDINPVKYSIMLTKNKNRRDTKNQNKQIIDSNHIPDQNVEHCYDGFSLESIHREQNNYSPLIFTNLLIAYWEVLNNN